MGKMFCGMRCGAPFPVKMLSQQDTSPAFKTGEGKAWFSAERFVALNVVKSCSQKIIKAAVTTVLCPGTQKKVKYMWDMDTVLVTVESPVLSTVPGT